MDKTLYGFNSSQDVINLQTKYTLFKRVANIVFTATLDEKADWDAMKQAINKLIERNDCLRIVFVKKDGVTKQYFADRNAIEHIPYVKFDTVAKMNSYTKRFRRKMANIYKGETIVPVFATDPSGKDLVLVKISHFVADTYAIGFLLHDLMAIYKAILSGNEMPAPNGKFEDVLKKDLEFKSNEDAVGKDRKFFKEYFEVRHRERPIYCGLHGDALDRWLKEKRKGNVALPYLIVKCDTEGYRFTIPAAVTKLVQEWCNATSIPMSTFFYYCYSISTSLLNGRAKYQVPLELLNCRATVADRKCGGTKVQSIAIYTTVDYDKSFNDNVTGLFNEQQEIYRHTRLSYLDNEAIQHKLWNYSMMSQLTGFCYSFIPMEDPEGVKMQVLSNGKGALVDYVAFMLNVKTMEVNVIHDMQTRCITPQQLVDFQNLLIHVVEAVVAAPDKQLKEIL